jgi:hypothetical protein
MAKKVLPEGVERVRVQFEEWRGRKKGRERIPERLWKAAAKVARRHGVNAVSQALRVEHARLRQRVEDEGAGVGMEPTAFIELNPGPTAGVGCIVELEKGNGTRMRICVRDSAAVDWGRMKEAFLGA